MASKTQNTRIPADLQPFLWSKNVKKLKLENDKIYIIHQLLSYGDLREISWLFRVYPEKQIKDVFEFSPMKIYGKATFNFVKNIILDLKNKNINPKNYVATLY
jgi:Cu/Ag efflux protein CusF